MKPLNLEETRLKEEMKSRCLNKGQYIDENAKAKFNMLCHLEDFEVQYWNLEQENKKYKEVIDKTIDLLIIKKARCLNEDDYVLNVPDLDDILQVLKKVK